MEGVLVGALASPAHSPKTETKPDFTRLLFKGSRGGVPVGTREAIRIEFDLGWGLQVFVTMNEDECLHEGGDFSEGAAQWQGWGSGQGDGPVEAPRGGAGVGDLGFRAGGEDEGVALHHLVIGAGEDDAVVVVGGGEVSGPGDGAAKDLKRMYRVWALRGTNCTSLARCQTRRPLRQVCCWAGLRGASNA